MAAVEKVTALAAELPGVGREHVMSLATEARDRLYPGSSETYGHFLKPLPTTERQLAELRQDLDAPSARLLTGTIVASDRSGTAVQVGVARGDRGQGVDREALVRALEAIVEPLRRPGLAIDVVGAPAAESLLASHVLRDMALLVPLSMLVIALVIWRGTRRAAPVVLALIKVGATIAWTFGVLGWLGVPVVPDGRDRPRGAGGDGDRRRDPRHDPLPSGPRGRWPGSREDERGLLEPAGRV